ANRAGGQNTIQFAAGLEGRTAQLDTSSTYTDEGVEAAVITCQLTIVGHGQTLQGIANVFGDGQSGRLFAVAPGASLTLEDLTLADGVAQGGRGGRGGAYVQIFGSGPGSGASGGGAAGLGGAVFLDRGTFAAVGCTFRDNQAVGGAGARLGAVNESEVNVGA